MEPAPAPTDGSSPSPATAEQPETPPATSVEAPPEAADTSTAEPSSPDPISETIETEPDTDTLTDLPAPSPLFASDSTSPASVLQSSAIRTNSSSSRNARSVTFSLNEERDDASSQPTSQPTDHEEQETPSRYSKQRTQHSDNIGATHVDERAPNINLRFFRGLAARNRTRSQRSRSRESRARRREGGSQSSRRDVTAGGSDANAPNTPSEEMVASVRPMSNVMLDQENRNVTQTTSRRFLFGSMLSSLSQSRFLNTPDLSGSANTGEVLIQATLVDEEEVMHAEAVDLTWREKHMNEIMVGLVVIIVLIGTVTGVVMKRVVDRRNATEMPTMVPSTMPSVMPSIAPSQDPRRTVVVVQDRGRLRCGLQEDETAEVMFRQELCRAVAAVVLGNPEKIEAIQPMIANSKWEGLNGGAYDLQILGDTRTVQREVVGNVTFSTPYYYDGASYNGNPTYVKCAYEQKRYEECEGLKICVVGGTTYDYVEKHFSPEFYERYYNWTILFDDYRNGTCNVIAGDRQATASQMEGANLTDYVVGNETFTNEPLAIVTRNDEAEWSDIVNWVMQALFHGEKVGLVQDASHCVNKTPTDVASELNYLNAVYCVGNYGEIFNRTFGLGDRTEINKINDGTAMLYVTPFGEVYDEDFDHLEYQGLPDTPLGRYLGDTFKCGVIVQDGCDLDNITASNNICGMGVDICTTLTASIYNGNPDVVDFTIFTDEEEALTGLTDQSVHVLVGLPASLEYDFGSSYRHGATFSMPYYYGNETGGDDVTVYSAVTSDGNDKTSHALYASYINCIILATVYAASEEITKERSAEMPSMTIFGRYYLWALKDAISANGNYDEIYAKNFGTFDDEDRGRNALNKLQTPQLFNNPGL